MQQLQLLFVILLSTAHVRAFWWSSSQSSEPPATKQVQYVRAFTYQPVAFPAHSLLAPPSPYKFIQANPASLGPNSLAIGKQVSPGQPIGHQQQQPQQQPQQLQQPQTSPQSPFSSFFSSTFGGSGQSSSSVQSHPNSVSQYPPQPQPQPQQHQHHQQQQQQPQQQQPPVQQPVVSPVSASQTVQSDVPSPHHPVPTAAIPSTPLGASFFGQPQYATTAPGGKYPYFTMDQVQYLSSLPVASAHHTPQVQFVPCMCPIAVNVQSHVSELADKRLDETTTTDSEVVVPSAESEK